jgi:hypothetical protein
MTHATTPWILLALALVIAAVALFIGLGSLRRARLIEDTPTARIRSAPQGYTELQGQAAALAEGEVRAPLTGSACCWFRYEIEKRHDKGWRTLEQGQSEQAFLLRDDTGVCQLEPQGAEITATDRSVWHGDSRQPTQRAPTREAVTQMHTMPYFGKINISDKRRRRLTNRRYRYSEERIYVGDTLYALGEFHTLGELDHQRAQAEGLRQRLRQWKQRPANLLTRFDRNGDGRLDPQEWQQARQAAARETAAAQAVQQRRQIPHRLRRSRLSGHPFIISSLPQTQLVRRLRQKGAVSLVVFCSATGAVLWWWLAQ